MLPLFPEVEYSGKLIAHVRGAAGDASRPSSECEAMFEAIITAIVFFGVIYLITLWSLVATA